MAKKAPIKSLSGKNLKVVLTLLLQVVADAKSAEQSSDLQLLYERTQANAEDIENFLSHPQRNLFDKKLLKAIQKESEKLL